MVFMEYPLKGFRTRISRAEAAARTKYRQFSEVDTSELYEATRHLSPDRIALFLYLLENDCAAHLLAGMEFPEECSAVKSFQSLTYNPSLAEALYHEVAGRLTSPRELDVDGAKRRALYWPHFRDNNKRISSTS
jgi:hypothetical protein